MRLASLRSAQSEAILKDPSNYWISVINAGRFFPLNETQEGVADSDPVGTVIARLMCVADAIALAPHSVASVDGRNSSEIECSLIEKFYNQGERAKRASLDEDEK